MFDDEDDERQKVQITVLQMHALVWTRSVEALAVDLFGLSGRGLKKRLQGWPIVLPTLSDRGRLAAQKQVALPTVPEAIAGNIITTDILASYDLDADFRQPWFEAAVDALQRSETTPISRSQFYELRWSIQSTALQELLVIGGSQFRALAQQFNIPIPPFGYFSNNGEIVPGARRDPLPEGPNETVFVSPKILRVADHVNPAPLRTRSLRDDLGPDATQLVEIWIAESETVRLGHAQEVIVRGFQALKIADASAGQIVATLMALPAANTMWRQWERNIDIEHLSYGSVDAMHSLIRFLRTSQSQFALDAMDWAYANPVSSWVFKRSRRRPKGASDTRLQSLQSDSLITGEENPEVVDPFSDVLTEPGVGAIATAPHRIAKTTNPASELLEFMVEIAPKENWLAARDRAILELMMCCKLLPRAIVHLSDDDVSLVLGRITYSPRGDRKVSIDIPDQILPSLIAYNRKRPVSSSGRYFIGEHERPIRSKTINEILDRRCDQMGLGMRLTPKSLRTVTKN